jgi:hypothetical protein
MTMFLEIGLLALAIAGDPAPAAPPATRTTAPASRGPAPTPVTQTTGPANGTNQTICRRQALSGSRLGTRNICRTQAEWDMITLDLRQQMERAQNSIATQCARNC